mmetsp:Transcript_2010/g.4045  ORF Transcript_2010/g.4045 Transcript_2010/m.4045 type:complete len:205 (-) Transcript_2010:166-780(-)
MADRMVRVREWGEKDFRDPRPEHEREFLQFPPIYAFPRWSIRGVLVIFGIFLVQEFDLNRVRAFTVPKIDHAASIIHLVNNTLHVNLLQNKPRQNNANAAQLQPNLRNLNCLLQRQTLQSRRNIQQHPRRRVYDTNQGPLHVLILLIHRSSRLNRKQTINDRLAIVITFNNIVCSRLERVTSRVQEHQQLFTDCAPVRLRDLLV